MNELKACPYCGGEAKRSNNEITNTIYDPDTLAVLDVELGEGDIFWVECCECYASTCATADEETADAAWNRRTDSPEPPKGE